MVASSTYLLLVTAPAEPPHLPGNCPESKGHKSWIPFHGHCYYFEAVRKKSWSQAHQECARLGECCVLERLKMQWNKIMGDIDMNVLYYFKTSNDAFILFFEENKIHDIS